MPRCRSPKLTAFWSQRTGALNVNEYSARYSVVKDRFYRPSLESLRQQSATNRQGGTEQVDAMTADEFNRYLDAVEALEAADLTGARPSPPACR